MSLNSRPVLVAAALALAISASCKAYDPEAYVLDPGNATQLNAILELTATPSAVQADGLSTLVVTAKVHPDASKKTVTFTASDGSFTVGAQANTRTAVVTADLAGIATTELRSSQSPGTVRIDASIQASETNTVRRAVEIAFTTPSADSLFTMSAASPTVAADGFSRVAIDAKLLVAGGTPQQRQFTFTSGEGMLYTSGKAANTTQTVPVGVDGVARVELESTRNLRDVEVTASIAGVSRSVVVRQTAIDPSSIIRLLSASSAPADGTSLVRVRAIISAAIPQGSRTVTFVASPSNIALSSTERVVDGSNETSIDVTSPSSAASVRVRGTVSATTAETTIQFVPALPDRIVLSAPSPTVAAAGSITVTAALLRDIGRVTQGRNVIFTARNDAGTIVGAWAQNNLSNAAGEASATFFPSGAAAGNVTITAQVDGAGVAGTLRLTIQ